MKTIARSALAAAALVTTAAPISQPASAKDICGWYAIAYCTSSEYAAIDFVNNGWGALINTNAYVGLRAGLYCVVSGPQSKSSAWRDRTAAIENGVSDDVYIKQACTDEANVGD